MNVKTTIELPDGLVSEAKRRALDESTTLRELVIRGLETILYPKKDNRVEEGPAGYAIAQPYVVDDSGWPTLDANGSDVQITNEMVNDMREELGI